MGKRKVKLGYCRKGSDSREGTHTHCHCHFFVQSCSPGQRFVYSLFASLEFRGCQRMDARLSVTQIKGASHPLFFEERFSLRAAGRFGS